MTQNKYVIGIFALLFFAGILIYAFSSSSTTYEKDFSKAALKNKKVKIIGELVKEREIVIDKSEQKFAFYLRDENGKVIKAICDGLPPNNFNHSNTVVLTGKFENEVFIASNVLTKCPSKYEADLKQKD